QLKLRLGWGVTGNQELSDNFYPSIPVYSTSNNQAQYIFGDGSFNTIRPNPYNPALKWEETTTYNAGLDFSFLRNRINGSVDVYQREVKDLLNRTFFPAGTNTTNVFDANIADMVTKGIEVNLNLGVISTEDINLEFGFNFTAQDIEVTKLIDSNDPDFVDDTFGGITGAIGNNVQALKAG